jgi:hypothetical protein
MSKDKKSSSDTAKAEEVALHGPERVADASCIHMRS